MFWYGLYFDYYHAHLTFSWTICLVDNVVCLLYFIIVYYCDYFICVRLLNGAVGLYSCIALNEYWILFKLHYNTTPRPTTACLHVIG